MPINFLATVFVEGVSAIPYYDQLKVAVPVLATVYTVRRYFAGTRNTWERDMHGRVLLITGGTSGLGAAVAREMALKGAQIVLLVKSTKDGWLADYIDDLRSSTGNPLIYAEEADLADLMSVRKFATKWIDNVPPRRLDGVVCCAGLAQPPGGARVNSVDGLEIQFQVNYLGHYHLLTTLAPALRSQPPDREVRIILTTCVSAVMGKLDLSDLTGELLPYPKWAPHILMGGAKLALTLFAYAFQRQFNAYERKDKVPTNVNVVVVDPGMMRSPSFKRFISFGSLIGLVIYLVMWPLWWLFLKSSSEGSQSLLYALMSPEISNTEKVSYVSECNIRTKLPPRKELLDVDFQEALFDASEKLLLAAEKETARERAKHAPSDTKSTKPAPEAATPPTDESKKATTSRKKTKSKSTKSK